MSHHLEVGDGICLVRSDEKRNLIFKEVFSYFSCNGPGIRITGIEIVLNK